MARRYNMRSVLGTILDPAADKTLMTTLTVTLAMKSLIPGMWHWHRFLLFAEYSDIVPLAVIILGRDVLLSLSAFYIRYTSLPPPVSSVVQSICAFAHAYIGQKTWSRYWDFSIPSAEVHPTSISKVRVLNIHYEAG